MHFNVYDVFYSQFSHQHVSASMRPSSERYYYKNTKVTNVVSCRRHPVTIKNCYNVS